MTNKQQILIRTTAEDKAKFAEAAKKCGLSLSSWIIACCDSNLLRVHGIPEPAKPIKGQKPACAKCERLGRNPKCPECGQ